MASERNVTGLNGVIVFRLGGQMYALPVDVAREVAPYAWLDRPPMLPAIIEGVLNLGGKAAPVLRLDRILGLSDGAYGPSSSILIMRPETVDGPCVGLLVEHVDGVRSVEGVTAMGFDPRDSFNGCLADQIEIDGQVVRLLSWRNVLMERERQSLSAFQAMAEARLGAIGEAGP